METVAGIDVAKRSVLIGRQCLRYDFLVVATGALHAYFGHDEWEPFAPGIKALAVAVAADPIWRRSIVQPGASQRKTVA
jgi:NADH dehydrogenase